MSTKKQHTTGDPGAPALPSSASATRSPTVHAAADASNPDSPKASNAASESASASTQTPTHLPRTPRLKAIEVENFKGIGRPLRIDLRPITLLFGHNSAGKSTVLHAFCYANEILNHNNLDADTTSAGGHNVRLGGFDNLIHSHDPTKHVRFRFDLDLNDWKIPQHLVDRIANEYDASPNFIDGTDWLQEPVTSAWVDVVVSRSQGTLAVTSYEVGINDVYLGRLYLRDASNVTLEVNGAHPLLFRPSLIDLENLDPSARTTFATLTSEIQSEEESQQVDQFTDGNATIASFEPKRLQELRNERLGLLRREYGRQLRSSAESAGLLGHRPAAAKGDNARMWSYSTIRTSVFNSALPPWDELLAIQTDDLGDYDSVATKPNFFTDSADNFRVIMSFLLVGVGATLANELTSFRYIGPVRDLHPDTGVGARTSGTRFWADGSAAWELLCDRATPGGRSFIDDVNDWLTREDRLDAGYRVEDQSYVELSADTPLVAASRDLAGLGVSFADELDGDLLDRWIIEQFGLLTDYLNERTRDALIEEVKSDKPFDPKTTRLRDLVYASALDYVKSMHAAANEAVPPQLAPIVTELLLRNAASAHVRYREFLAVNEILLGNERPEIMQLLKGIASARLHTRLRLVSTSAQLPLSTADIGVGISQVLPVLVAALDPNRPGLTAIEQPELHVHPRLQVQLGELFVPRDQRHRIFLLETHSEHLLLRLLRRILETTNGTLPADTPSLKPDDLSVVFIEQHGGDTRATRLPIDTTGEFTVPWPHGFFEERHAELF